VGEFLEVDRITLSERLESGKPRRIVFSHTFHGNPVERETGLNELHPWAWQKMDAGEHVAFALPDELPPEAAVDRAIWEWRGTRSMLAVPISVAGEYRFGLSVATVRSERKWSEHLAQRLRVLGETLANALMRGRMDQELQQRARMLRSLNTELSRTEDLARRRLASVLHDDLAQNLFGVCAELNAVRNVSPYAMQGVLDRILAKLDHSLKQARDLTYDLCPPVLYELGLLAALEKLVERFNRQGEIRYAIASNAANVSIDSELASVLYQAVRELFINVAKHSKARHAEVAVEKTDDCVTISVSDDGIGCVDVRTKTSTSGSSFGLFNIRERLQSLEGQLTIDSQPGRGCVVRLSVPIHVVTMQEG